MLRILLVLVQNAVHALFNTEHRSLPSMISARNFSCILKKIHGAVLGL